MKKIVTLMVLLTAFTFLFAQAENKNASPVIEFSSEELNGQKITNEMFASNKITMINIWGTFCGPCIREMPDLAKLSNENKSKNVEIIGIPIDLLDQNGKVKSSTKADAEKIMKQAGVKYKNVIPTIEMFQTFLSDVQAVPTTIFVDKNGNQIGEIYLGARSKKEWQKIIDELLESQK